MKQIKVDQVTPNLAILPGEVNIGLYKDGRIEPVKKYKEVGNLVEVEISDEDYGKINAILGVEPESDEDVFERLRSVNIKECLKQKFVKSEKFATAVELAIKNEENLIVFGPGGYGKSDMIKHIMKTAGIDDKVFYMSCGEDTDESKLWGGIDIPAMKEGKLRYNVKDSFINYPIVVFEELLDAQVNAILALKDTLEAKEFRKGSQRQKIRTKIVIALTNKTPREVAELGAYAKALMERFRIELNHDWPTHSAIDYMDLFSKVDGDNWTEENHAREIANTVAYIMEIISEKKSPICPRIALTAFKVAKNTKSSSVEEICNVIKYVHEISECEPILEDVFREMKIKKQRALVRKIEDDLHHIDAPKSFSEKDIVEFVKQLKELKAELDKEEYLDEVFDSYRTVKRDIEKTITTAISKMM